MVLGAFRHITLAHVVSSRLYTGTHIWVRGWYFIVWATEMVVAMSTTSRYSAIDPTFMDPDGGELAIVFLISTQSNRSFTYLSRLQFH